MLTMAAKKKRAAGRWAKLLIELRRKSGLTQTELGKEAGVTQRAWQSWETGSRHPGGSAVLLLLQILANHGIQAPK